MEKICCMPNGSYSMYDSIHSMIEEYCYHKYDFELNLDTADKIATYVEDYICSRLEEFKDSIRYKTLEERLYAAIAEEFDVAAKIFVPDYSDPDSEDDAVSMAISVANYIQCRYLQDSTYDSMYEEIDQRIAEDEEFAGRISRIKEAIGIL